MTTVDTELLYQLSLYMYLLFLSLLTLDTTRQERVAFDFALIGQSIHCRRSLEQIKYDQWDQWTHSTSVFQPNLRHYLNL